MIGLYACAKTSRASKSNLQQAGLSQEDLENLNERWEVFRGSEHGS